MATTREIPGYYYDPDKQKYFKIAKSHTVPPTAPYSADAVRKRKADDEARQDAAAVEQMSRGRIHRAAVLDSALLGGALERERGGRLGDRAAGRRTYVERWAQRTMLAPLLQTRGAMHPSVFDVDVETGTMVFACGGGTVWSAEVDADAKKVVRDCGGHVEVVRSPEFGGQKRLAEGGDNVGAIAIDPATKFVLATWVAPITGPNACLKRIDGRGSFADVDIRWRLESRRSREPQATTRCTATAPAASPYSFALGGDHPLFLIRKDGRDDFPPAPPAPLFALAFLPHDPSVLLAGQRSGLISLLDLRTPRCASGHAGIAHAASVARIRPLSPHAVVVAGLQDTLCVYDLRYLSTTRDAARLPCVPSGPRRGPAREFTVPVVGMRGHRNVERHDADVAVDAGAGVVAAAQVGRGADALVLFDAGTGGRLRSLEVGGERVRVPRPMPYVRQLRFVEGRGLWASGGQAVVEYAW